MSKRGYIPELKDKLAATEALLARAVEALEFIACEGMDDGDFYAEEDVTAGTIAMANRARETLAAIRKEQGE
jgi:hypothetical protein